MMSLLRRSTVLLRKSVRRYIARPALQQPFRLLYRVALAGMNYGGAGSYRSAGDELALERVARLPRSAAKPAVIIDVGANVGVYTEQALEICGDHVVIYAIEPAGAAFKRLAEGFGNDPRVHVLKAGIGAAPGVATLWSDAPGSVLASLYVNPVNGKVAGEEIEVVTLDGFCEEHGITHVDLLKLDLEGGELDALRGATRLLESGVVRFIQFEFGQPSLGARTYFVDLFELLHPRYDIYRVLPTALEPLAGYHETLEVFMSTNYLAIARAS